VRDEAAPPAVEAVRAAVLPEGTPYAWIAGESSAVREVRRHLVRERGFDRGRVTFVGYWRRGLSEEQVRAAAESDEAATGAA
ncbi:MAG TPA: SIP domain-containing protein, partial [Streptomyces sp.]